MEKTCVICGVIFNANRSDAEVCSQRCRQKNWRRRKAFGEKGIKSLEFEKQVEEFLLNPKNKEFRDALLKKMRQDMFDFGSAIVKTDSYGQQSIINPLSPEGQKVIDMAKNEPTTPPEPQKHKLWEAGDPAEKSMAFYMKYDCYTYDELQELKNKSK